MLDPASSGHRPGIFLSYSHGDKSFVRRLGKDLASSGVRVWIDEGEMRIGDSLLAKVSSAISEMDYLGAVISPRSQQSEWVTREIEIAMREEVRGEKVKVLPLLLRGGELPPLLRDKVFADFTSELKYAISLSQVLSRLGVKRPTNDEPSDPLTELASSSALLTAALQELRNSGWTIVTAEALASSSTADVDLTEFLSLVARELRGQTLFGFALWLVRVIDDRAVGQEALNFCLRSGRLEKWQLESIASRMQDVTSPSGVLWCHSQLTSLIKSDASYHSFLVRHMSTIVRDDYDAMAAYLLHSDRGPTQYNLDSFELVISQVSNAAAFQIRCFEWINGGKFDNLEDAQSEPASTLYSVLNEHWDEPKFMEIKGTIQSHVRSLMSSRLQDNRRRGLYHLVAMIDTKYRGAEEVLADTLERRVELDVNERRIFELVKRALRAVSAFNREPSERDDELVSKLFNQVSEADQLGITGYWERR